MLSVNRRRTKYKIPTDAVIRVNFSPDGASVIFAKKQNVFTEVIENAMQIKGFNIQLFMLKENPVTVMILLTLKNVLNSFDTNITSNNPGIPNHGSKK